MVVTVDEHPRLLHAGPDQGIEGRVDRRRERAAELDPEVARKEPPPEEMQLVTQLPFIVRRRLPGADAALHVEQRIERIGIEGVGVSLVEHVEIGT